MIRVILGFKNLDHTHEFRRQKFSVNKIVINPRWDSTRNAFDGDISLLILKDDVRFSRYIQPICREFIDHMQIIFYRDLFCLWAEEDSFCSATSTGDGFCVQKNWKFFFLRGMMALLNVKCENFSVFIDVSLHMSFVREHRLSTENLTI